MGPSSQRTAIKKTTTVATDDDNINGTAAVAAAADAAAVVAVVVTVDAQVQSVLDLLDRHVAGEVTNLEVEQAVARLLLLDTTGVGGNAVTAVAADNACAATKTKKGDNQDATTANGDHGTDEATTTTTKRTVRKVVAAANKKIIDEDMDNYDDDDDDDDVESKFASNDQTVQKVPYSSGDSGPAMSTRKRRRMEIAGGSSSSTPRSTSGGVLEKEANTNFTLDRSWYADIPLGYQGARMMTTFGDGKQPLPEAVAATLQGVRRMLQVAIQDARYLRRRHRQVYASAKRSVGADTKIAKEYKHVKFEFSTEVLFKASEGHDPLAKEHKCGFAIGDLHILFPEELNAYMRWSVMNAETEAAQQQQQQQQPTNGGGTNNTNETPPEVVVVDHVEPATAATEDLLLLLTNEEQAVKDGHLQERAAMFDVRTHRMPDSWYMTYSELRQGSFLPPQRGRRGGSNNNTNNNSETSGWGKLTLPAIRFLHWCGFDPESPTLPPPNEDTVDALAFLGYDFVGRVVEKAIAIRKYGDNNNNKNKVPRQEQLLELDDNQQLTAHDIALAMEQLNPVPLYSSSSSSNNNGSSNSSGGAPAGLIRGVKAHPLYFGPGFENRLEMEIEEFMIDRQLSPEEEQLRQQEDEFFANLAATTTTTTTEAMTTTGRRPVDLLFPNPTNDDEPVAAVVDNALPASELPPPKKKRRRRKSS
jgi:hypothetical protein